MINMGIITDKSEIDDIPDDYSGAIQCIKKPANMVMHCINGYVIKWRVFPHPIVDELTKLKFKNFIDDSPKQLSEVLKELL